MLPRVKKAASFLPLQYHTKLSHPIFSSITIITGRISDNDDDNDGNNDGNSVTRFAPDVTFSVRRTCSVKLTIGALTAPMQPLTAAALTSASSDALEPSYVARYFIRN